MGIIEHDNIFYVRNIHSIGGVETFVYELAKKYKDKDIAIVCKSIASEQKERLKKYCRVYIHKDQQIKCKVIITNWDTSIFDYVNEDAKKYTVLHTDYSNPTEILGLPKDRPDITYIGITEDSKKKFEKITGIDRTILCRNPLEIEEDKPILTLVSATRMTEIKDNGRHLKLAQALERQGIEFIWYIFTTDEYNSNPIWNNENVIHMKNRLELGYFMKNADWYVQLSSCEGDSYSLKEALYRGTPIVVCELPYFKEIGIEHDKNALFLTLDCSNVDEIARKMKTPLKFKFEQVKDGYDKIIANGKSHYEEDRMKRYLVEALPIYQERAIVDNGLGRIPNVKEQWEVDKIRLDELLGDNSHHEVFVKVIKEIKPVENAKLETKSKKKIEKK